ncbi:MAG TPA: SGNH/GDSL hydrolase family protein [Solidesulfovibrio sp.]|nr:hypothetical protein [Desulfovibrio sp.]HML60422.1 SGNH/GDSL hydrolase family protein [Solidesulfovibrio sp.]
MADYAQLRKDYAHLDNLTQAQLQSFKAEATGLGVQSAIAGTRTAALGSGPRLVAEGDSWFDYMPGTDLIDCLRYYHGYDIKNFAQAGDTLENMVYGSKNTGSFAPRPCQFELVAQALAKYKPKVFLFSGGGNDIAGDEFAAYLNHTASGDASFLRLPVVDYMFAYFERILVALIGKVKDASPGTHIVMHGYGCPVPTGKGVGIFGFCFAGPWLRPALASKRIDVPKYGCAIVKTLIDRYNTMLAKLDADCANFHHADVRDLVNPDTDWENELHLTNSAYARVAYRIHEIIEALP